MKLKNNISNSFSPSQIEKTEKSVAEMEADYNKSFDWNRILEAGVDLQLLAGQG